MGIEGFQASPGWLDRFMARNGLSMRRATTACQKPPMELMTKLVDYFIFVKKVLLTLLYYIILLIYFAIVFI